MLTVEVNGGACKSCCTSEAWLTNLKTKKCRLVLLKHMGWQYKGLINEILAKRGFRMDFR